MIGEFFSLFQNESFLFLVSVILAAAPIWLPIFLVYVCYKLWMRWRRKQFILSHDYVLLEVKLPSEIPHSPKAMENVFSGIHITAGEATWYDVYVKGKLRPWFAFELVSIGGTIHFYIWTRAATRDIVEAQIYGQYPDVQVIEVEDYARKINYRQGETSVWGANFALSNKDAYPIKTYVDYGLDRQGVDEPEKIDPMASVLEYLSSLKPGEQAWIQIIAQATKNSDRKKKGGRWYEREGWKDQAKREIEDLREKTVYGATEDSPGVPSPTSVEGDIMSAIERSLDKHGFECGIRAIYVATSDAFKGTNIPGLITTMKHFSSNNLNGIRIDSVTDYSYPWQDYKKWREGRNIRTILDHYRKRSWYHPPASRKSFVLTTEELATLYHFPGSVVQAPGLERIDSKRGEAPTNLPI